MSPPVIRLCGLGWALPPAVRTNAELAEHLGIDEAWIHERTGIQRRHVLTADESLVELATQAGRAAMAEAQVPIDMVVVATVTAPEAAPALACRVAAALNLTGPSYDVSAACAGFLYGLAAARAHLLAGDACAVLVVGADRLSDRADAADRDTAVLFGDGAGAVVLAVGPGPGAVLDAVVLGGDPTQADALRLDAVVHMQGRLVYRQAMRHLEAALHGICARVGWAPEDLDLVVPHQANGRLLEAVAHRLNLGPAPGSSARSGKIFNDIEETGNTSAASIPVALGRARAAGRLRAGHRVVLVGLGAGLVWGAAALRWGGD